MSDRIFTPESCEQELGIPAETIRRWINRGMPHQHDAPKGKDWSYWFTESALLEWLRHERKWPSGVAHVLEPPARTYRDRSAPKHVPGSVLPKPGRAKH